MRFWMASIVRQVHAHSVSDLGQYPFDRIGNGRIGCRERERGRRSADRCMDDPRAMVPKIVDNDDLSGPQRWGQELRDLRL